MDLAVVCEAGGTPAAHDVVLVETSVQSLDLLAHEAHGRRVRKRPVPILFAALAVTLLVHAVPPLAVVEYAFVGHAAR